MAKWYAWSELRNGGETKEINLPQGGTRQVLVKRNSVAYGEEVTMAKIGCSKEDWERWIEGGSVRNYPPPKGVGDYTSASEAFMADLLNDRGDVDVNKLMELGLSHPPAINPPASEASTVPAGA